MGIPARVPNVRNTSQMPDQFWSKFLPHWTSSIIAHLGLFVNPKLLVSIKSSQFIPNVRNMEILWRLAILGLDRDKKV